MQTASIINDVGIPRHKQKTNEETHMTPPKLLRTVAFSILTFLFAVAMGVSTSYAQDIYVSTGGDDNVTSGAENDPYQTITYALDQVDDDGFTIHIEAGDYTGEGAIDIDNDFDISFVAYETGGGADLVEIGNLTIDTDGDIEMGLSGANFQLANLTLTDGSLSVDDENVSVVDGGLLSIAEDFDFGGPIGAEGELNVTYTSAGAALGTLSSTNHFPADLADGNLTITRSSGSLVITQDLVAADVTVNAGNGDIEFSGAATVEGTLDLDGEVSFTGTTITPEGDVDVASDDVTLSSSTTMVLAETQNVLGGGTISGDGTVQLADGADVTLTGDITVPNIDFLDGSAINAAAQTLTVLGDFDREQGATFTQAGSTVVFGGGEAQELIPGPQLTFNNLSTATASTELTIRATIDVDNNLTFAEDTEVNLGVSGDAAVHIRLAGGTFDNEGGYTTPTDVAGYVIVEGATDITGEGTFGNLDVRDADVTATSDIAFSGTLYVRDGQTLGLGANTMTFTDGFVDVSTVNIVGSGDVTGTAFEVDGDALYDLDVDADVAINLNHEIAAEGIRDLTIDADGNTATYGGPAFEVVGAVDVAAGSTFDTGAVNVTLSGDDEEHSIGGTVTNGTFVVTGDGVSIDGTEDDESDINNLTVNTSGSFSSTDLQAIADVVITEGTASITLNENAGTIANVTITDGSLALDMGDDGRSITANLDIVDGDLSISEELTVDGTTDQADGDLSLGSSDFISTGVYTRAGTGAITASSGTLVLNDDLDNTDADSDDLSVVNLEVAAALTITTNQNVSMDQTLTVTGDFTHTAGVLTLTDLELVVSGDTYNYVAGSVAGTGTVVLEGLDMVIDEADNGNNPQFVNLEVDGDLNLVQGGDDADESRTITVTSEFTHTSGQIDFGAGDADADDNNLNVAGTYTRAAGTYVATEGGTLTFNGATDFTPGSGFSIPNMVIDGGDVDTQAPYNDFEVTESFEFGNAGNLNLGDDDEIVFADGVTITRTGAATISDVPDFGDDINVIYSAAVTTGNELPSTVSDLEIGAAVQVAGGFGDLTVDGELTLDAALTFTDNDDLIITENATIVENTAPGSVVTGGDVELPDVVASLTLGYNGDETDSEFFDEVEYTALRISGAIALTAAVDELNANVTVIDDAAATLTLGANTELNGSLSVLGDGSFDMNTLDLTLTGDLTLDDPTNFTFDGELVLGGDEDASLTLDADWDIPNGAVFEVNREGVLTLSGGNLNFATPAGAVDADLVLEQGVVDTEGDAVIILGHDDFDDAGQGFERESGLIAGNVRKFIPDNAASAGDEYDRVIFPVGSDESTYRPLTFNFGDADPDREFNLTVSHTNSSPKGLQGLPAGDAIKYPNFYWRVESDLTIPLSTDYEYQVQAEAEGYEIAELDFNMDDVTLIRRAAGDETANQWNQTATNYDNELTEDDLPIVRGLNTTQLIRTQPRLLTFGIPSTIRVENEIAETAVNVGQTRVIDISGVFDGTTGEVEYEASSDNASTAVVDSVSGTDLYLTGVAVGSASVTIDITDGTGDTGSHSFDVSVSAMLASSVEDQTVNIDQEYKVSLYDWFTGGSDSLEFSVTNAHDSVSVPTIVGAANDSLEIDLVSVGTDTITITAIDSAATDTLEVEFALTISGAFAATGSIDNQTLRAGDNSNQAAGTFTVDSLAGYFNGGSSPITYSATSSAGDTASAVVSGDTLTVTALLSSANPDSVTITVTAEDATGATVDQMFKVLVNPAYGDVLVDGEVTALDARQILGAAIGEEDFTDAQTSAGDVNEDGNVNAFDASITFRYSLGSVESLPFSSSSKVSPAILAYGEANSEEGLVRVPLNIEGSDIVSVDFDGSFDANAATLESLDLTNLPDDWMVVESTNNEGEVKFALAGTTPISEGELATITFKLKDDNSNIGLTAKGFVNNSEYSLDEATVIENPQTFALEQNYPNPFNPTTNVRYQLPASADVTIELFTISGQKVQTLVNTRQNAGVYTLNVDGSRLASGVYIYRIVAKADNQTFTTTKKMTLIK